MTTEAEARLFFVEHELIQAHHTISFLRDCIDGLAQYTYPEMTERHLRDIESLVELPEGCGHSMFRADCAACWRQREDRLTAHDYAGVLGWPSESGRWPRPPGTATRESTTLTDGVRE